MPPKKSGGNPPNQSRRVPKPLKSKREGKASKVAPRYKPADKFVKEMKRLQETDQCLIPRARFARLVREITVNMVAGVDIRYQAAALRALQEAAEAYIVGLMEDSYLCSLHSKRVTLMARDIHLAYKIRGDFNRYGI